MNSELKPSADLRRFPLLTSEQPEDRNFMLID